MKKILYSFFFMFIFSSTLRAGTLNQWNTPDFKIGSWRGSSFVKLVQSKLPKATLVYFKDSNEDLIEALRSNKIDAFLSDRITALNLIQKNPDLEIDPTPLDRTDYAMAFNKTSQNLRDEFANEIQQMKEDGTLESLQKAWFLEDETLKKTTIAPKGERGTLRIGTTAVDPPFSYYKNNKLVGIEIELVHQIAKNLNYSVEWFVINHSDFISALQNDQIDVAAALLTITPQRSKVVLFGEPDYEDTVVFVRKVKGK